jgi:hypothetical protein
MTTAEKAAYKIMALVDEFPSKPFSFERKQMIDRLECFIAQHTEQVDDELDESFNLGVDTGRQQMRDAIEDAKEEVRQIQKEMDELKSNVKDRIHEAYSRGYLAAIPLDKGGQIA